jgi:hypothetical protein
VENKRGKQDDRPLPELPGAGPPGAFGQPGMTQSNDPFLPRSPSNSEGALAQHAERVAQLLSAARTDASRGKLTQQLHDILEKQFDMRQQRHEVEIEQLEAQVRKLRELVQKRQEHRRDIIASRLDVIVRDSLGLGW